LGAGTQAVEHSIVYPGTETASITLPESMRARATPAL